MEYLKFRFFQFFRCFNHDINKLNYLFISLIIVLFVKFPNTIFYSLALLFIFFSYHIQRKDLRFVRKLFPVNRSFIIFFEYLLFYLIALFLIKDYQYDLGFGLSLFVLYLIALIPSLKTKRVFSFDFISFHLFEIKSYIRRNLPFCVVLYALLVGSTYHFFTFLLLLIILLDYISNIFLINEPKEIYTLYFSNYSIKDKIKSYSMFFHLLFLPVYIIYIILHYKNLEYLLVFITVFQGFLIERILYKYKNYNPKQKENYLFVTQSFILTVKSFLIFPVLLELRSNIKNCQNIISDYVRN